MVDRDAVEVAPGLKATPKGRQCREALPFLFSIHVLFLRGRWSYPYPTFRDERDTSVLRAQGAGKLVLSRVFRNRRTCRPWGEIGMKTLANSDFARGAEGAVSPAAIASAG